MERIRGKASLAMDAHQLAALSNRYDDILIDIGTGDGRFVRRVAERAPQCLAIGVDACRENLHDASRRAPENAVFLIANALTLPAELAGLATRVTVNFPWGSLLAGLLEDQVELTRGLYRLAGPDAEMEVRLNAGALAEQGWGLEDGAERVRANLRVAGFVVDTFASLDAATLRHVGTTWAKRLADGRDPRAVHMRGVCLPQPHNRYPEHAPAFVPAGVSAYGSP